MNQMGSFTAGIYARTYDMYLYIIKKPPDLTISTGAAHMVSALKDRCNKES